MPLTAAEREALILKIEQLPAQLSQLVEGATDEQLDRPYREGGWSSRQVIHHMADSHMMAYTRCRFALTEEKPPLKAYDQDAWAQLPDVASPIAPSLQILAGLHRRWTLLFRGLREEQWASVAMHQERGEITLDDQVKLYAGHGEKHLQHIRAGLGTA